MEGEFCVHKACNVGCVLYNARCRGLGVKIIYGNSLTHVVGDLSKLYLVTSVVEVASCVDCRSGFGPRAEDLVKALCTLFNEHYTYVTCFIWTVMRIKYPHLPSLRS